MRTSADSIREQATRFFAMAQEARDEGKSSLAELLTEAGRRAIGAEPAAPIDEQQDTDPLLQQQENGPKQ